MPQERKYPSNRHRQAAYRLRQKRALEKRLTEPALPPMPPIPTMPGSARWTAAIDRSTTLLTAVREEMQTYFDDRSEAWQEGERAEAMLENMEALEQAIDALAALRV